MRVQPIVKCGGGCTIPPFLEFDRCDRYLLVRLGFPQSTTSRKQEDKNIVLYMGCPWLPNCTFSAKVQLYFLSLAVECFKLFSWKAASSDQLIWSHGGKRKEAGRAPQNLNTFLVPVYPNPVSLSKFNLGLFSTRLVFLWRESCKKCIASQIWVMRTLGLILSSIIAERNTKRQQGKILYSLLQHSYN